MYLGAHVSSSGGIENSIKAADIYNINAIQMMPTTPMRWTTKLIPQENIEKYVDAMEGSVLKKILIHGIYLTNLAREDKQMFHLGKMGLVVYLDFANRVSKLIKERGLDVEMLGICFHPGSKKELGYDESLERISEGIDWVLDEVEGEVPLLIESTAGTGNNFGRSFEELKKMRDGSKNKKKVGFVIDTQHTYAAGYDWVNNLDGVVNDMKNILGIENVKSFHLNDSMMKFNSNKDRHADLGRGEIGEDTMRKILHRPEFKNIPFILETPSLKKESTMQDEIDRLKELAK